MFQSQFSSGIVAKKKIVNYTVKSKIYHCISLSCDVHTHAYNMSVNNHEAHHNVRRQVQVSQNQSTFTVHICTLTFVL